MLNITIFTALVMVLGVTVQYNEIHNVALVESDMGCTYFGASFADYGNTFRYNLCHHAKGANGLYFDDGGSGYVAYGNILYNVITGTLVGGGHHVRVVGNLYIKTSGAAVQTFWNFLPGTFI